MCGICGYSGFDRDEALLRRMVGAIRHRGPDDEGYLVSDRVGLGMSRLSIIDVAGGHQPIYNEDESLAVVYNGEIYNYPELRAELLSRGHRLKTRCDTEAIVHLYEDFGPQCVDRLRGMFAIAIFDARRNSVFVARDRLGIKPLYYWANGGRLVFGSEIKSILECPQVSRSPHLPSIDRYLSLRYVPGPETLFDGIRKFPAAHWGIWKDGDWTLTRYWEPEIHAGPYEPDGHYREQFSEIFTESVRRRLMSDVPFGAFLSGGLDSSAIVAAMSRMVDRPVRTYSVGFDWPGDELPAARAVAQRLGCEHHEIVCRPEHMALLPKLVWHLDEPIGDAIVLPMYLLSQAARQHVKVILTGEGADETQAGYFFHRVMTLAHAYARLMPRALHRGLVLPAVSAVPPGLLSLAFDYPAALGTLGKRKFLDYLRLVGTGRPDAEYRFLISLFDGTDKDDLYTPAFRANTASAGFPALEADPPPGGSYLDRVLGLQYADWLPDDILMKQDKMSMANSIEGRVPFLDHKLVEFLCRVPPHLKRRGATGKVLLRGYLDQALPGPARRRKKAFYIPLEQYLARGPLSEIVAECLSESSVRRRGYFEWSRVRALRESVEKGDFLFGKQILALTMLELWHRIFLDREAGWL